MKEPIENWKGRRETADVVDVGTFQDQIKRTIPFYGERIGINAQTFIRQL